MKAMVLVEPEKIELREIEMPIPGAGEVLIKISHAGICGTDTKIFSGAVPSVMPLVIGHEIVGEIAEGRSAGARVLVDPVLHCGDCYYCKKGQTNLCANGTLMGREINGGFAEYCVAPDSYVYTLPDSIESIEAPAIQVLTTVVHAFDQSQIQPGDSVVILGLGVTGLMQVQVARAMGADPVVGVSRNSFKRGLAEKLGADLSVNHGDEAKEAVLSVTGGLGADVVIESVGHLSVLAEAIDIARHGACIVPFGIYGSGSAELPFYDFYFKELKLINARAALAQDFPKSIDMVQSGAVDLASLITHRLPVSELGDAIKMLIEPSDRRLKIILET